MKFLLDQDIYAVTVKFLLSLGHQVTLCKEAGLTESSDEDLIRYARENGCILITRDKGYGSLIFVSKYENPGIILLRIEPVYIDAIHQQLRRFLEEFASTQISDLFVVIEPSRYRVRKV